MRDCLASSKRAVIMLPVETLSDAPDEKEDASQRPSMGNFVFKAERPKKEVNQQALKALSVFAQKPPRNPASLVSGSVGSKQQTSVEPSSSAALSDQPILVGEIVGAHGIAGQIKVLPYAQQAQGDSALMHAKCWQIVCKDNETQSRSVQVLKIRTHNRDTLVADIQVQSKCIQREDAQALRGWKIYLNRATFPKLKRGEYYWVDLIGLSAVNLKGVVLGTVVGLLENSAHAVLRIAPATNAENVERAKEEQSPKKQSAAGKAAQKPAPEILIPFVKAYIGDVCFTTRTIEIDWEGEEEA